MTALDEMISPATAVAKLGAAGIQISERALRERAREIGAYRQIGRAIFFTPEDLEKIMEPPASAPSPVRKVRTGRRAVSSTESALDEARAKLRSLKHARNNR